MKHRQTGELQKHAYLVNQPWLEERGGHDGPLASANSQTDRRRMRGSHPHRIAMRMHRYSERKKKYRPRAFWRPGSSNEIARPPTNPAAMNVRGWDFAYACYM